MSASSIIGGIKSSGGRSLRPLAFDPLPDPAGK
jgi:hypothetical protein